jgi:hypothetical protein
MNLPRRAPAAAPSELPRGFGVRWLAGNRADTALEGPRRAEGKAVCALTPHPPHSKTLARRTRLALVQGRTARKRYGKVSPCPPRDARRRLKPPRGEGRRKNDGAHGEVVRNRGWKSPRSGGQASGVQNENDEWKSLTNRPRPRVAWRKENRWTFGTTESNNRREAYPGKRVSRKRDPHPA